MNFKKLSVLSVFALLVTFVLTTPAAAQRLPGGGGNGAGWVILTYSGDAGPFPFAVDQLKGGAVSFNFFPTPDRAMLITDVSNSKQFAPGKLIGKSLSARFAISATTGAIFNHYDDLTGGTLPGGFVRLYFQRPNAAGCPPSSQFDPNFPQCEAQYWWSNPLHFDLAQTSSKGITLQALLSPENWSDRDGHQGDTDADHIAWFNDAVANANKIALSFGGGDNFAFGCGVDPPGTATFTLLSYAVK